jgi:hypothetical protein
MSAGSRAGTSGASSTFQVLSMPRRVCDSGSLAVCRRRSAASHARLLARSGAAAFGRTGAPGASQRGLRPHCGAAESGFIGRRRRLGRALYLQV